MDSPLAPKPIIPGLRPHRVDRTGPDRRRKGRSFEDELAHGQDEDEAPRQPPREPHPPAPDEPVPGRRPAPKDSPAARPQASPGGGVGRLLDLEA
jgi:hypothetical protein